jgi:uncharacterized protein
MTSQIDEKTGLSQFILQSLRARLKQFPQVRHAYLFGSRARGNWTAQSDIDLAIDAPSMTAQQFAQLWSGIDALPIAFPLDCVWLQSLKDSNLKAQILQDALVL